MYVPRSVPSEVDSRWLHDELQRIAQEWQQQVPYLFMQVLYAAPEKLRDGMLVVADGTTWNPGSGAGVYGRVSGAWVKL